MCNCNQKRTNYSQAGNNEQEGMVKVKLVKNEPIILMGNITGRMYAFRNIDDINWVDRRDAQSMTKIDSLQIFRTA